jgi:uncharacterized protein (DUF302 family)
LFGYLYGLFLSQPAPGGLPYVKRTHEVPMEPIVRTSRFAYSDTVMRLGIEIARAGATIFCKLDQGAAARAVGVALRPTTLFIFGNAKAGAQLSAAAPLAALDLPLKLLVWEQRDVAHVAYLPACALALHEGLSAERSLLTAMGDLQRRLVASVAADDAQPVS